MGRGIAGRDWTPELVQRRAKKMLIVDFGSPKEILRQLNPWNIWVTVMNSVQVKMQHQPGNKPRHKQIMARSGDAQRCSVVVDVVMKGNQEGSEYQQRSENAPVLSKTIGAQSQYDKDERPIDSRLPDDGFVRKLRRQPFFLHIPLFQETRTHSHEHFWRQEENKYRRDFEQIEAEENVVEILN